MKRIALLVVLSGSLAAAAPQGDEASKKDIDAFQGTWKVIFQDTTATKTSVVNSVKLAITTA